jgi:uncharacterized protein DUF1707/cell wall-active antibiotic response 4TMS protein YvqF
MAAEDKPALLIGDSERERGVAQLRDAVVDGRLTLEEFSERVGGVQLARTEPELAALVADVPAQAQPPALTANVSHRAVCSRLHRGGYWELDQSSQFSSIFGTIDLDLRQATLHGDVVEVNVFNLFGTVTVIVPEGISVTVEGGGMFASQVIEPPATPPVPGSPRLRIKVSGPGGTLHVRAHSSSRR